MLSGQAAGRDAPVALSIQGFVSAGAPPPQVWYGDNDNGQDLGNGMYYFKLESLDPFGSVTSFIQAVQVAGNTVKSHLAVYNSAGELVRELPLPGAAAEPVGFTIEGGETLSLGAHAASLKLGIVDRLGGLHPAAWDGQNSQGLPVQSGTYLLKLVNRQGGVILTKSITVIAGPAHPAGKVLAFPNPMISADRELSFAYEVLPAGQHASVSLYSLAGELLARGVEISPGRVRVQVGKWAPGIYVAAFEVRIGTGLVRRQLLRLALKP